MSKIAKRYRKPLPPALISYELAHVLCGELESNELSIKQIAKKFNVKESALTQLLKFQIWDAVTQYYNFSKRYDDLKMTGNKYDKVIITELIRQKLSDEQIAKKLNVPLNWTTKVIFERYRAEKDV